MGLNVDRTLKAAKKLEALNKLSEAVALYRNILDVYPKNQRAITALKKVRHAANYPLSLPDSDGAVLKLLTSLFSQEKYQNIIELRAQIANQYPESAPLFNIIGSAFARLGAFDVAVTTFLYALERDPKNVNVHNNLGESYGRLGNYQAALTSFRNATDLDPQFSKAFYNMANTFFALGDTAAAIDIYKKSIALKPEFAPASNNLGAAYLKAGQISEAFESFARALRLNPQHEEAFANLYNLSIQCPWQRREFLKLRKRAQPFSGIKTRILALIDAYIHEASASVEAELSALKLAERRNAFNALSAADQIFCSAYYKLIQALVAQNKGFLSNKPDGSETRLIYHLGESHCLSFAHLKLRLEGQMYKVQPMISFGTKVFHLSDSAQRPFSEILRAQLRHLPKRSKVMLSFGEIDCRLHEGFLAVADARDIELKDLIAETVAGYLRFVGGLAVEMQHQIFILNVPAPLHSSKSSAAENASVANIVHLFNQSLAYNVHQSDMGLVDMHKFTSDSDGFSNRGFHCDESHLDGRALQEIERRLTRDYAGANPV